MMIKVKKMLLSSGLIFVILFMGSSIVLGTPPGPPIEPYSLPPIVEKF